MKIYTVSTGQILIQNGIEFTSAYDSLRQISSIAPADSLSDALTAKDYVSTRFINSNQIAVADSTFYVNTTYEMPNYTPGMLFYIHVPVLIDTINIPKYINLNSQGTKAIVSANLSLVTVSVIKSGRIIALMYNGNSFVVINQPSLICPTGYVKKNENYCIQKVRNPKATFWIAQTTCYNQGAHLCYYDEWYYACINNAGLTAMPTNYEWVNTTSNHNIHALIIGAGVTVAACTTTESETTATTGLPQYFRCCFKLR